MSSYPGFDQNVRSSNVLGFSRGEKLFPVEQSTGYMAIDDSVSDVDTWRAMERFVKKGKARALGVSNFDQQGIEAIIEKSETVSTPL